MSILKLSVGVQNFIYLLFFGSADDLPEYRQYDEKSSRSLRSGVYRLLQNGDEVIHVKELHEEQNYVPYYDQSQITGFVDYMITENVMEPFTITIVNFICI